MLDLYAINIYIYIYIYNVLPINVLCINLSGERGGAYLPVIAASECISHPSSLKAFLLSNYTMRFDSLFFLAFSLAF